MPQIGAGSGVIEGNSWIFQPLGKANGKESRVAGASKVI
jgi:hypothetical protein